MRQSSESVWYSAVGMYVELRRTSRFVTVCTYVRRGYPFFGGPLFYILPPCCDSTTSTVRRSSLKYRIIEHQETNKNIIELS